MKGRWMVGGGSFGGPWLPNGSKIHAKREEGTNSGSNTPRVQRIVRLEWDNFKWRLLFTLFTIVLLEWDPVRWRLLFPLGRVLPHTGGRNSLILHGIAVKNVKWTPSERQVGLPQRLPQSTYFLRTPKQLPSPTELLAISTYVAV